MDETMLHGYEFMLNFVKIWFQSKKKKSTLNKQKILNPHSGVMLNLCIIDHHLKTDLTIWFSSIVNEKFSTMRKFIIFVLINNEIKSKHFFMSFSSWKHTFRFMKSNEDAIKVGYAFAEKFYFSYVIYPTSGCSSSTFILFIIISHQSPGNRFFLLCFNFYRKFAWSQRKLSMENISAIQSPCLPVFHVPYKQCGDPFPRLTTIRHKTAIHCDNLFRCER